MVKRATGAILPTLPEATDVAGAADAPLYLQIYRRVRGAILGGSLGPGSRLPSTRTLAGDLGVSRNTVECAFAQLRAEGFLERRVGAGSYVARVLPDRPARPRAARAQPRATIATVAPVGIDALSVRGASVVRAGDVSEPGTARAFAPCAPGLADFPMPLWNRLLARRSRRSGRELLNHADPAGYPPLREAVAGYLGTARGVRCDWRQVLILASTQQAMDLAARLTLDPGDVAWLEEPGYLGARAALLGAGARVVGAPVDDEGLDVAAAEARAPRARLAYITPSHHYPLGVTMSLARRLALLRWAERASAWILEDDYDSEFRYSGRPLAAVQGLDTSGRVLYAGTFNKVMFPSLRLAYLVVPSGLVDAFVAARAVHDGSAPALSQAVLTDFIADGHFGAHVRQMRSLYRERRDALLDAVERQLGGRLRVVAADAGMHVTGWLPSRVDDRALSARAAARGLDLPPLSRYYLEPTTSRGLVINFAGVTPLDIRRGMRTLAMVMDGSRPKS